MEFNFDTFSDVIDAVGGVEVDLTEEEYEFLLTFQGFYNKYLDEFEIDEPKVDIHPGVNTLCGYMAQQYARARHVNAADSDMNRVKRQQKVVTQVVEKLRKMSVLELNSLIDHVLGEIVTNISTEDMTNYITELTPFLFDVTFYSNQCPADGTYKGEMKELPDGLAGVLVNYDFAKNKLLMENIQEGGLPETAEN